jgi:hypothetical protein
MIHLNRFSLRCGKLQSYAAVPIGVASQLPQRLKPNKVLKPYRRPKGLLYPKGWLTQRLAHPKAGSTQDVLHP